VETNYSSVQPVELGGAVQSRVSLKDVYTLYGSQFRRWFWITAPLSVLAAVVLLMADRYVNSVYGSIPRGELQDHWGEIAGASAVRCGGFFISWFLGCFALAAIATVVHGLDRDDNDGVWRSDTYQRAREHIGALFVAALFTFGVFVAGAAILGLVEFSLIRAVGWARFSRLNLVVGNVGYVVVASIVSWFGMAIPLILSADIGAWAALKKSLRLSNGYEGFLFLLVVESLAGSYVAWYAVHYGLTFLFPLQLRYTEWYGWLVYFVAILASAAVQPPMFIGFSLLAATDPPDSRLLSNSE
jgi:hypothetical protein